MSVSVCINIHNIHRVKTRTIHFKITYCSFLLLPALVYEDLNYAQTPSNKSLYGLLNFLSIVQILQN